jgi:hypothetical protein
MKKNIVMNGYLQALSMDTGFLGMVVVAFSPYLFIWKCIDITLNMLGVNFAVIRNLLSATYNQGYGRIILLTQYMVIVH